MPEFNWLSLLRSAIERNLEGGEFRSPPSVKPYWPVGNSVLFLLFPCSFCSKDPIDEIDTPVVCFSAELEGKEIFVEQETPKRLALSITLRKAYQLADPLQVSIRLRAIRVNK